MKNWIRIVVAFVVVIIIGFAVWAFFLKKDDNVLAFESVSEAIDYKESLGLKDKLANLREMDYLNKEKSNKITGDTSEGADILKIRKLVLGTDTLKLYGEDNITVTAEYDSYYIDEVVVDNAIESLLPFLKGDRSTSKTRKEINTAVSNYVSSLKYLNEAIDLVLEFQNNIPAINGVQLSILQGKYQDLRIRFRNSLGCGAKLINTSVEYISNGIYGGTFKADSKMALFDIFAIALDYSTSVETIREIDFANDTCIIRKVVDEYLKAKNIFVTGYSEIDFLTSYNTLNSKYRSQLVSVLGEINLNKKTMAAGSGMSGVVEGAQKSVSVVLKVVGF